MTYVGQGLLGWDKRLLWVDESEEQGTNEKHSGNHVQGQVVIA